MIAVDTNVLLYACDPRDLRKQQIAIQIIDDLDDGALLWQVACEYLAAARKLSSYGFSEQDAYQEILILRQAWQVLLPTWRVFNSAGELRSRFSLSIWDSLIVAQCLEGNVTELLTEDFDAYPVIDTLKIKNPFCP